MKKDYVPLVVGIALPIIIIVVILVMLFVPNMGVDTEYDFVYTNSTERYVYNGGYSNTYRVIDDKLQYVELIKEPGATYTNTKNAPSIYLYDTETHRSKEISFETASKLNLDGSSVSLDGHVVEYISNHDGIFEIFGSSDRSKSGYYLVKGNGKEKLSGLQTDNGYYNSGNFKFLGWVKQ